MPIENKLAARRAIKLASIPEQPAPGIPSFATARM